jgi:hypothetical protein
MSNLLWLQNWYAKQSYHSEIEIQIKTNESKGWEVYVNLENSKYNECKDYLALVDKPEYDQYSVEFKNGIFTASGNFSKLDFLVGILREIIGETEPYKKRSDYFWDEKIQQFLFEKEQDQIIFLHYTIKKSSADNIIKTGFKFYDFDKTAVKANNYSTELNYNHNIRRQFGDYVVVICFSRELYLRYLKEIDQRNQNHTKVEEILAEKPAYINEDQELVYTLHHKYIKGYFNYFTREIVPNPDFDPYFDSGEFLQNMVK